MSDETKGSDQGGEKGEAIEQVQSSLDAINAKLEAMSEKSVSGWEKAGILLGVLTPITIAGLGFYLNNQISERESAATDKRETFSRAMAEKTDRVARLALMPAFVDALSSGDEKKQLLAIRTINLVMPIDGPAILEGIIESEESIISAEAKRAAENELNSQVSGWIQGIFSQDKATRLSSFEAIQNSSVSPNLIAKPMIEFSNQNINNKNGVFNTLTYLNTLENPLVQTGLSAEILKAFAEATKANGTETTKKADELIGNIEVQR